MILGEGSFGRVRLAVHKPSDVAYALKGMRKGALVRNKQVDHVVNEKRVLAMCDHPFILKLAAVFNSTTEVRPQLIAPRSQWRPPRSPPCGPAD